VILPRCVKLAELSQNAAVRRRGLCSTWRMYGADHRVRSAVRLRSVSSCSGLGRIAGVTRLAAAEVARICRELRRQVQRINPKFQSQ